MQEKRPFIHDVFLSHNSADKDQVRIIANRLKAAGLKVWFDEWNIQFGDDIFIAIENGLQESRTLILFLSDAALGSDWVTLERSSALFRDPINKERRFIPVLLSDCSLPDTLRRYKYLDLRDNNPKSLVNLIKACRPSTKKQQPLNSIHTSVPPASKGLTKQQLAKNRAVRSLRRDLSKKRILDNRKEAYNEEEDRPDQSLRVFKGHENRITGVIVTPDNKSIISTSYDKKIKIWDINSAKCMETLEDQSHFVGGIDLTPDNKFFYTSSYHSKLKIWDLETKKCISTINKMGGRLGLFAISPDGKRIAASSNGLDIKDFEIWDIKSEEIIREFKGHSNYITDIAFTQDGKKIITAGLDKTLKIWDSDSGKCINTLTGHKYMVGAVMITPDCKDIISGSNDNTIIIWDLEKGNCKQTFTGHQGAIQDLAMSNDGNRIISVSSDKKIKIWDFQSGKCLKTLFGHNEAILKVIITPDGKNIVTGSTDRTLRLWSLDIE
jgi:WD40 repeat protein